MENKLELKNRKGQRIMGILNIPENPIGLAFVEHGLGGFKEQKHIMAIVEAFLNHHYTVVNFDATNSIGESEGKYENATMQNHYEDLVDVITWAKTQNWYKEPFVLAGHSLGGYSVAQYAEDYPKEVKAVFPYALLVAGELSYNQKVSSDIDKLNHWKETGWQTRTSNSKPGLELRLPWSHMEERLLHDARKGASKLTMPVLFVVGENDISCPPETQKVLFDLVPGPKEMHIVTGAPHTFKEEKHLVQLREILSNWIDKIK